MKSIQRNLFLSGLLLGTLIGFAQEDIDEQGEPQSSNVQTYTISLSRGCSWFHFAASSKTKILILGLKTNVGNQSQLQF